MKTQLIAACILIFSLQAKAQFFEKLVDKAADAATSTLEAKIEGKAQKETDETFDKVFESDKDDTKNGKRDNSENKKDESNENKKSTEGKTILITQSIFEKNAMALTTNKIPDLDKAGAYLSENKNARATIKSHVESGEDATDLSEFRSMLLKTMLVRKYELNEDFISIEICEPGNPNNRNVEIILH